MGYSNYFPKYQCAKEFSKHDDVYGRIWDNVDFIVSSGTDQFFVMTNGVLTPDQLRKTCPEDYHEIPSLICGNIFFKRTEKSIIASKSKVRHKSKKIRYRKIINWKYSLGNTSIETFSKTKNECTRGRIKSYKSHGVETGNCVRGDRENLDPKFACEIKSWCPVEQDTLPNPDVPLISGTENFTVFIKNTITFPSFGSKRYRRNNMPNGYCVYEPDIESTWLCPIFRLGDIVKLARGIVNVIVHGMI